MSLLQALTSRMAGTKTYAKAVDFDGTNDYLSRASDFTGNADGKTFTFSVWVWEAANTNDGEIYTTSDQSISVSLNSNSQLLVKCYDAALSGVKLWFTLPSNEIPRYGFTHILFSVDMSDTGKRYLYINDVAFTPTWNAYVDSTLGFAKPAHYVGAGAGPARLLDTRLSNVFLDYTYRDLSNVTNRRLFITADRKPAQGQAALNPILYLPMDDPTTAHINQGTGGNFTLNGVVARSGRGPNQYNVAYSDLDGAADYLQRSSLIGVNDGAAMTASFVINADNYNGHPFCIEQAGAVRVQFWYESETSLRIVLRNSSATILLNATAITKNHILRNTIVTVAFDLSDTAKRHIYCNGEAASVTWATYTNGSVNFSGNQVVVGARADGVSNFFNGRLGNVFFDTKYIDLSVAANLAKFVTGTGIDAKPVSLGANGELPTGTAPLIYLPMYGNNAGKNYGTGGDFTVNSGPYPGARGPNEFWGNKAAFSASSSLGRTSALALSNSKTFSFSFFIDAKTQVESRLFVVETNIGNQHFYIGFSGTFSQLRVYSTDGLDLLAGAYPITNDSGRHHVCFCVNMDVYNGFYCYIDGVSPPFTTLSYTTGATITLNRALNYIGSDAGSQNLQSPISEFYFTTDYIDFSLEANRLLFRDAFGNPTDLPSLIESGAVPNPAVYMRFDPANQGLNSGTGGNFTKSGTITDGGQL